MKRSLELFRFAMSDRKESVELSDEASMMDQCSVLKHSKDEKTDEDEWPQTL